MSADNIIYVKKIKDEFNIWEQSASVDAEPNGRTLKKYTDELEAYKYAFDLQEDWQTEYGVCKLDDESVPAETQVKLANGVLADKMLDANTRLILNDSTDEDEQLLRDNKKFLREYITALQNMLDDIQ